MRFWTLFLLGFALLTSSAFAEKVKPTQANWDAQQKYWHDQEAKQSMDSLIDSSSKLATKNAAAEMGAHGMQSIVDGATQLQNKLDHVNDVGAINDIVNQARQGWSVCGANSTGCTATQAVSGSATDPAQNFIATPIDVAPSENREAGDTWDPHYLPHPELTEPGE